MDIYESISLDDVTAVNLSSSVHKFTSFPSRIGPTPQPHQRETEAAWWQSSSGLGSPCLRHFIILAQKTNPECNPQLQVQRQINLLPGQHVRKVRDADVLIDVGHVETSLSGPTNEEEAQNICKVEQKTVNV